MTWHSWVGAVRTARTSNDSASAVVLGTAAAYHLPPGPGVALHGRAVRPSAADEAA